MPAPKVIGPYEIVELLGRGGMGEVYKAVDTRMYRRPVALKLISEAMGADPRALSKFDQEVETAANLRHPNIVQIYDRGEHEGRRYFTMEFLEGRDLTEVIKERELSPLDSRLDIIVQICDALDYAHAHGVVHRDIKPANIRVITRGGTDHVKVIDFGIAHVDRSTHTRTVVQPGTTLYMSPEQLNDEQVSPKSDLFSVGIVAYELCSGVHPFKARTEFLTGSNIMREKQTPLRSMDPSAPEALETLLERLLEKDRDHRPASAAAVSVELKSITRQLRTASSDGERAFFGNLDEMTGPMVERIVHWAKGKEQSGAIVEAIEAYKRAILLAPNAPWLHARVASLEEQLKRAPELDVQPEDDPSLRTSSRNRHREAFVRESMVEAGAALDDGELDQASSIAAAILRQYPDEPAALALMDQIVVIIDRGLELKPYRQALRAAREALARDDLDGAQRALEAAVAIWPDDHEVITLGQEIEARRQVEMERALEVCDGVLGRASAGTLADDAAPAAVAQAREALRRAEDLGAPAALVGGKRSVLDRILSDALARAEERERKAREVEDARRAEAARLLGEATRMLSAAERATSADAATARAALADVRAALDAIARTESLGADPVETSALRVRSDTASRSLEEHIAREQARDREVAARLDAIRSGLADIERMVAGEVEEALQAEEPLNVAERDLAALAAERPSAKDLPGLRQAADGLRTRIAERRRAEDERRRAEDEHRAKALREQQELETKARLEREALERAAEIEQKKAAAKAERLRTLLAEARTAFKQADDLAASIETEADQMLPPLAAARGATDKILEIEPGEADATALRSKIEKLTNAAAKHADKAAQLREQEKQRRLDDEAERITALRAARRKWLARGLGAIVVLAVTVGGVRVINEWQKRKAAEKEEHRLEQIRKAHAEATSQLATASKEIESLRGTIDAIVTQDAKENALARCDAVSTKIEEARRLDASHSDLPRLASDLSNLRGRIESVVIIPPEIIQPPKDELASTLDEIRKELEAAGKAPAEPLAAVEAALQRADHGIVLASGILKKQPDEPRARSLLADLKQTQSVLQKRRDRLIPTPPEPIPTWRKDLSSADSIIGNVEAQLKRAPTLADPEAAKSDCQHARRLIDGVLRDHPGDRDATGLLGRITKALEEIQRRSIVVPPPPPPPPPDDKDARIKAEVTSLSSEAKRLSLALSADVTARIALDRQILEKLHDTHGQDWASARIAEAQSDLDTSQVWRLFHKYRDALVARSPAAILDVYPSYPSVKAITEKREIEYAFDIVELNVGAKTAVVRETIRSHNFPDYWDKPITSKRKYALDRRPDGSWVILSGTLAR